MTTTRSKVTRKTEHNTLTGGGLLRIEVVSLNKNLRLAEWMRAKTKMQTIFDQTINGTRIVVKMKDSTNSLWLTVNDQQQDVQDVYAISSVVWDWHQLDLRGPVCKAIQAAADAAATPNPTPRPEPVNLAAEALESGDINKFAKGGAL